MNKYAGETPILLGDAEYKLVYDWKALAEIHSLHGADAFKKNLDPNVLVDIVVCGLKKNHPQITRDFVLNASPPLLPTINTVAAAVNLAYYGVDGEQDTGVEEQTEKKI
jgi:hypothetical protein